MESRAQLGLHTDAGGAVPLCLCCVNVELTLASAWGKRGRAALVGRKCPPQESALLPASSFIVSVPELGKNLTVHYRVVLLHD